MLSVQAANNQAVTPAQAGVHSDFSPRINGKMDSSIRWNDAVRRMATKDALNKLSLRTWTPPFCQAIVRDGEQVRIAPVHSDLAAA